MLESKKGRFYSRSCLSMSSLEKCDWPLGSHILQRAGLVATVIRFAVVHEVQIPLGVQLFTNGTWISIPSTLLLCITCFYFIYTVEIECGAQTAFSSQNRKLGKLVRTRLGPLNQDLSSMLFNLTWNSASVLIQDCRSLLRNTSS
jgi:hypothetical protein